MSCPAADGLTESCVRPMVSVTLPAIAVEAGNADSKYIDFLMRGFAVAKRIPVMGGHIRAVISSPCLSLIVENSL